MLFALQPETQAGLQALDWLGVCFWAMQASIRSVLRIKNESGPFCTCRAAAIAVRCCKPGAVLHDAAA